jgi:hypothetical protein
VMRWESSNNYDALPSLSPKGRSSSGDGSTHWIFYVAFMLVGEKEDLLSGSVDRPRGES